MGHVTVVGSVNIDLTTYLDRWPDIGETVNARETRISLGGKGANQAVAVARLGSPVTMIGAIGADGFGQDAGKNLASFGVTMNLTQITDTTTGMAFIDVGPDGANIIRISGGANHALTPDHINARADQISSANVLLLQNEIPLDASLAAALIAREGGAVVIMDPAPAPVPMWDTGVLASFDILTPNAQETRHILGAEPGTLDEALSAATALKDHGVRGAIVTMGEMGVAWSLETSTGKMSAPTVKAIDSVAAGDCFNGALAAAMVEGLPTEDAIRFAMHAAALSTTRKGASVSLPSRAEVRSFSRSVST